MSKLSISRNHTLGAVVAKQRAQQVIQTLGVQQGVKGAWSGNTFTITHPANGRLVVGETTVQVELTLGFMQSVFAGVIESQINAELDKQLR